MTIVNLYPDDPRTPTTWRSADLDDPNVVLWRRATGNWTARLERRNVAHAASAEELAAHLCLEHGLVAVLNANAAA